MPVVTGARTPPGLDPGAWLPAGLAALLALALALQLWLGAAVEPPPAALGVARTARPPAPAVPPVLVPAILTARDVFTPPPPPGTIAAVTGPTAPLGGATVAGTVAVRRRAVVVLTLPGGATRYLPRGGTVGGWVLIGFDNAGARFARDGKTITIAYGAAAPAPPAAETEDGEPQ